MMILAIGHEAQVGKDTFAMFLIDHIRKQSMKGLNVTREGFADRLYDLAYSLYKWGGFQTRQYYLIHPQLKEVVLPKLGRTPRDILIGLAEAVRLYDPAAWLNAVLMDRAAHLKIIPDLRNVNEFEICEQAMAYRLRIKIPGLPPSKNLSDKYLYSMPDERWSETILNDGDLECLNRKAQEFGDRVVIPVLRKYLHGELKVSAITPVSSCLPSGQSGLLEGDAVHLVPESKG